MAIPDNYEICVDWNGDGDFTDANEDITSDIKALNWQRGKDKQLGSTQAAILNLVIKPGAATKYSPENAGSVLVGTLLPYKVVRVRVDIGGAWYTQFYGYIKKIVPHPHWGKNDAYIYCVDGMEQLARAKVTPALSQIFYGTSSSGYIYSSDNNYATAHDAASGDGKYTGFDQAQLARNRRRPAPPLYQIGRIFLYLDTPSLPLGETIVSAKLRLMAAAKGEVDSGQATLHIVEGVQNDPLQLSDFGAHLSKIISGGSIVNSDITTYSRPFDIDLNAIGLGWINLGGITKFCLRISGDINNNVPSGNNDVTLARTFIQKNYVPQLIIVTSGTSGLLAPRTESQIVNALLDAAGQPFENRTIDDSNPQLYDFWSEEQPVLQGIKNLENMTGGMFYFDYRGYAIWESRNYRSINKATPSATFNNTMFDLPYELSDKDIFNHIVVKWTPAEPAGTEGGGGVADVTCKKDLYHRLYYEVVNTQTFYTNDGEEAASWSSIQAEVLRNMVDVTSQMTIYIDKQTRTSCTIKYANNAYSGYPTVRISWLSVDYTPLQAPEDPGGEIDTPSEVEVIDPTSAAPPEEGGYGKRTKNIYLPYPMDREDALSLAYFYLAYYKDPVGLAQMILKNDGATNLLEQFSRRISDRITCVCDRLGMTATDFFINKVDQKISLDGAIITSVFHLEKAATQRQLWVLDVSALDTNTRLAPG